MTHPGLRTIEDERVLGIAGEECALGRGKARGRKTSVAEVVDCALSQGVSTVIGG